MDLNQEKSNTEKIIEPNQVDGKKNKTISVIVIIILLLFPIVFILFKTIGNSDSAEQKGTAGQKQEVDVATFENAANSNPNFSNLLNLSNAYISASMPDKSIPVLKKAIALNPNSAAAYNNLGVAFISLQQYQKGIDACLIAIKIDSTFQLAKNNLAWGKDEQKKLLMVIQQFEQTPENKRDNSFYINYGLIYLRLENYDKSIEIWGKILEKDPKNSTALNNTGTALMMKAQYDEAIQIFKKAMEYNANDQLAKNNLNWALGEKSKNDALEKK